MVAMENRWKIFRWRGCGAVSMVCMAFIFRGTSVGLRVLRRVLRALYRGRIGSVNRWRGRRCRMLLNRRFVARRVRHILVRRSGLMRRSEEHTSELQSRGHLVCRLLREKITEFGQGRASGC